MLESKIPEFPPNSSAAVKCCEPSERYSSQRLVEGPVVWNSRISAKAILKNVLSWRSSMKLMNLKRPSQHQVMISWRYSTPWLPWSYHLSYPDLGCPQQFLQRAGAPRFPQHAQNGRIPPESSAIFHREGRWIKTMAFISGVPVGEGSDDWSSWYCWWTYCQMLRQLWIEAIPFKKKTFQLAMQLDECLNQLFGTSKIPFESLCNCWGLRDGGIIHPTRLSGKSNLDTKNTYQGDGSASWYFRWISIRLMSVC